MGEQLLRRYLQQAWAVAWTTHWNGGASHGPCTGSQVGGVRDQVLYVFGRMRVQEIVPLDDDDQQFCLGHYFARYGGWRFLAPTCTSDVVIGSEGTGIHLDRPIPGEILKRLTYRRDADRGQSNMSARMAACYTR